jgi:uncharacterized protein DUF1800
MLKPISAEKWNFATAAHLLNRAGFGGTPAQIEALVALGPQKSVYYLLDYEKIPDPTPDPEWAKPDPEREKKLLALRNATPEERRQYQMEEGKIEQQRIVELRGWWLQRMARGPRPFQEKMTLFWHGHFATSVQKVREAYLMWRQNELFRRLAVSNWLTILVETAKDPAMLIWLDQAQSRKEHPNENFAREVMELFALGEGHYTEHDITEAARALTGWSYDRLTDRFVERPNIHDSGIKTVLGRTGNLDGEVFLEQIVAQPQAALFITGKLWNFFAGQMPSPELNAALAYSFRSAGNYFRPFLRDLFLSEEFYSPSIIHNQVKSPVQWLVGTTRMLECELPPPQISAGLIRNLGQDLFAPPNVKGWDGGLTWITTNTLLARYNEAEMLVQGDLSAAPMLVAAAGRPNRPQQQPGPGRFRGLRLGGVNVENILTGDERTDKDKLLAALEKRLLQSKLNGKQEKILRDYLDSGGLGDEKIRGAMRLIMSTPEYQLT